MTAKISKAQVEVWEWKEKAYFLIKDLPKEEQIKFILQQTKDIVERIKAKEKTEENINYYAGKIMLKFHNLLLWRC